MGDFSGPREDTIEQYTVLQKIQEGAISEIYEATRNEDSHRVIIKGYPVDMLKKRELRLLCREVRIMHLVSTGHPNIVSLEAVIRSERMLCLVLEYCGQGDLFEAVTAWGSIENTLAKYWFGQIVDALIFCHSLGVVHRDIKLENVFITKDWSVRVGDFGLSCLVSQENKWMANSLVGSMEYAPPELFVEGAKYDARKADIWSSGVLLYAMLMGTMPFSEAKDEDTVASIRAAPVFLPPQLDPDARELLRGMLRKDPGERPLFPEVAKLRWLEDAKARVPVTDTSDESTGSKGQREEAHQKTEVVASSRPVQSVGPEKGLADIEEAALHDDACGGPGGGGWISPRNWSLAVTPDVENQDDQIEKVKLAVERLLDSTGTEFPPSSNFTSLGPLNGNGACTPGAPISRLCSNSEPSEFSDISDTEHFFMDDVNLSGHPRTNASSKVKLVS